METSVPNTGTPQSSQDPGKENAEALAALSRFTRSRPKVERCELCGAELAPSHPHLLDRQSRQVACSCDACAILFSGQQAGKFMRVPRRVLKLESFAFDDLSWEALTLPINLAFFLRTPKGETQVMYPSPAGAMSSQIELPPWKELFPSDTAIQSVEPEVEALLVNRIGTHAYFIVPLDSCYKLVGLIRTKWRGLSGGLEIWGAIAEHFTELDRRATIVGGTSHA